jgi:hypothetical protein
MISIVKYTGACCEAQTGEAYHKPEEPAWQTVSEQRAYGGGWEDDSGV